jgi:hypothetical protein
MAGDRHRPDAFALKNSGLDAFLYADVGTELNGSPLTILSVLARLGANPWEQATIWAGLPRDTAIDELSHSIEQMPLGPVTVTSSRDTATRLIQLLPGVLRPGARAQGSGRVTFQATWPTVIMVGFGIALWMLMSLSLGFELPAGSLSPAAPPTAIPGQGVPAAVAPTNHAATVAPIVAIAR